MNNINRNPSIFHPSTSKRIQKKHKYAKTIYIFKVKLKQKLYLSCHRKIP